jgi:MSHA biogenesis protein MshQ
MKPHIAAIRKSWSVPVFSFRFLFFSVFFPVLLLILFAGTAQAATYAYRNQAFAYDTPSAGATTVAWHASGASPACTSFPNGDDDWADVSFPGGFTFTFAGTNYSGVRIYSNGILAFGNDVSGFHRNYTPQALPITGQALAGPAGCPRGVPARLMLPYWIDIVAGTANSTAGASVKHEILGTAPNRRFVISWDNVKLYNSTTRYNFQVVLYEGSAGVNNYFEYRYTSGSSNGANATVGVQVSTTDYTQYSYNQQFIDTTNGTSIFWYPANQLATKGAEYRFDEGVWTGGAGEVQDTSGNSQDAQRLGNASNIANGRLCRGGSFTNNTSNATIDAVATPVVPGNTGSVSFWYRSNNSWNTANTMLFDATAVANRPFFLMKRSTGALRFAIADSSGTTVTAETGNLTYAANSWQHIGVTWNVRTGTNQTLVQIFINGTLVTFARGTTNGTLPAIGSIYVGDNRTSGVTPNNGTPNGANGTIDEFYIYPMDVSGPQFEADMNLTRPTCTALDHFRIIHDGTAACGAAQVTIEAHDVNHALFDLAGTTMTVSTSTGHGTWSAVSAINPVTNTVPGTATYTFANENRIVLSLNNPYTETVNINLASGTITERSGAAATCTADDYTFGTTCDADLVFGSCVGNFECLESGLTYNNLTTSPTARNPLYTKLSGTGFSFDVVALDTAGNRVSNYAADTDQAVTVELVDASGACASLSALSPAVAATLTFTKAGQPTDQGRKTVGFTVAKAYANLRCRVTDANQVPSVVGCSTDSFAIRPPVFTVTTTNATNTGTSGTPIFKAGSDSFNLTASAVAGYGGTPLVNNTLTIGTPTVGTVSGSFGAANTATGIAVGNTFTYSEAGNLGLNANAVYDDSFTGVDQPNDCTNDFSNAMVGGKYGCKIGSGAVAQTTGSSGFGRFIPNHFILSAASITPAGGTFSYMDQPFGVTFTLAAVNASGGTTMNYAGSYAKLDTTNAALWPSTTLGATGLGLGAKDGSSDLSPRLTVVGTPTGNWTTGTNTVAASLKFSRPVTTAADATWGSYDALDIGVAPQDADGVKLLPTALDLDASPPAGAERQKMSSQTKLRFGRLRLINAYGSELLRPRVEYRAEYWDGNRWTINLLDATTPIVSGNIVAGGLTVSAVTPLNAGSGFITFNPAAVGSYDIALNLSVSGNDTSCNAAHGGTAANRPWLKGFWAAPTNCGGVAAWAQDPNARIRLGSPKAPHIYLRERY